MHSFFHQSPMPFKLIFIKVCFVFLLNLPGITSKAQTELVRLTNHDSTEILTILEHARVLCNAGYYDSALDIYRFSLKKSIAIGYKYGLVKSIIGLGISEVNLGKSEQALQHFEEALSYCDTADETKVMIATIYNNQSNIFQLWGDRKKAINLLQKALKVREHIPSQIAVHLIYINMATILDGMGRFDEALYYLNKAETDAGKNKDYISVSNTLHAKGTLYISKKEWDTAVYYFEKALQTGRENGYDDIAHSTLVNLARIALERQQPHEALSLLHQANQTDANIAPHYKATALQLLGETYTTLKQYGLAENSLHEALALAKKADAWLILLKIHNSLHYLYITQGNFNKAYAHLAAEKQLSDSLNNVEKVNAIMNIEARYRLVQKDKELTEKQLLINDQKSSIKSRNIWIGTSSLIILLGVIVLLLLLRSHKQKQALKDERVQHLIKQQELREVKAIINAEEKERSRIARDLHDGIMIQFSTVKMNLSALMGGPDTTMEKERIRPYILQLDKATQSLRKAAHHLMPDMLLDGGLAEALYYFCNSLQKDVHFTIHYEQLDEIPRFEIQFELAVYRIIQELMHNIIKHAQATEAYIQLSYSNQQLGIDVEDNGIGMNELHRQNNKGLGLKSIEARVLSLHGNMQITTNNKGTNIALEFNTEVL